MCIYLPSWPQRMLRRKDCEASINPISFEYPPEVWHSPWKYAFPKGNNRLPTTNFQGRTVKLQGGFATFLHIMCHIWLQTPFQIMSQVNLSKMSHLKKPRYIKRRRRNWYFFCRVISWRRCVLIPVPTGKNQQKGVNEMAYPPWN